MTPRSDRPLRILHCIHSLCGGGAESQLRILTAVSQQHGMSAGIFCVNPQRPDSGTDQARLFCSTNKNKYNVSVFGSLGAALEEFQPHILHAWLPASMTIPAMVLSAIRRIPCVFSYRSAMHFHRPLTIPEFLCACLFSSQVVSNNPIGNSRVQYRWLYRIKGGVEIPNAVHIEPRFLQPRLNPLTALKAPVTILYAGRLVPEKNWRCLVQAVAAFRNTADIRLLICGDGPERGAAESLVKELHLTDRVNVLGFRTDLHALMQEAEVFVLPSWFEGMPNALLEALAIGLPAIVSDIPAHRDLIGTTGCALTFDPASPEQLADGIRTILTSETRRLTMIEAGRELAASRTPGRLAEQYRVMYERLLSRCGAACA